MSKHIALSKRKNTPAARKAYAIRRMAAAARRLIDADSIEEEIQAGQWTVAWSLVAGSAAPERLREQLRARPPTATAFPYWRIQSRNS